MHVLAEHVCEAAHAWSQPPQCLEFTLESTQLPSQYKRPDGHAHAPLMHTRPPSHALAQVAPDCFAHAPLTQLSPDAQVLPQTPQFAGSACTSTHFVPQAVSTLPPHVHCPSTQLMSAPHV